jgi:hypothetical protein
MIKETKSIATCEADVDRSLGSQMRMWQRKRLRDEMAYAVWGKVLVKVQSRCGVAPPGPVAGDES